MAESFVFDEAKARTYCLRTHPVRAYQTEVAVVIHTACEVLRAKPGDWVIRDPFWGFYRVLSPEAFRLQYEERP